MKHWLVVNRRHTLHGARMLFALGALLACGAALRADDSASPKLTQDQILERWATALGGRERLAALQSIHLAAQLTIGGQKGRFETWFTVRGARRDLLEMPGQFRQEIVFDGSHAWVRDASGRVQAMTGADLANQVTSAYQATYAWLVPGRLPGEVALTGESAAPPGYVFVIRPRNGTPYTVFLDRQTFLPVQVEQRRPGGTSVQTLSSWRAVGGILFPWAARQSSGDPSQAIEFAVESIEFDPTLDPRLFSEPAAAPPGPETRPAPVMPP
jgi:hypothetical protein